MKGEGIRWLLFVPDFGMAGLVASVWIPAFAGMTGRTVGGWRGGWRECGVGMAGWMAQAPALRAGRPRSQGLPLQMGGGRRVDSRFRGNDGVEGGE